jgi:hypothetical protein
MMLVPQGHNPIKLIQALEKRVEALENALKRVESDTKPKVGRPPKVKDEPNQPQSSDSSGN